MLTEDRQMFAEGFQGPIRVVYARNYVGQLLLLSLCATVVCELVWQRGAKQLCPQTFFCEGLIDPAYRAVWGVQNNELRFEERSVPVKICSAVDLMMDFFSLWDLY